MVHRSHAVLIHNHRWIQRPKLGTIYPLQRTSGTGLLRSRVEQVSVHQGPEQLYRGNDQGTLIHPVIVIRSVVDPRHHNEAKHHGLILGRGRVMERGTPQPPNQPSSGLQHLNAFAHWSSMWHEIACALKWLFGYHVCVGDPRGERVHR